MPRITPLALAALALTAGSSPASAGPPPSLPEGFRSARRRRATPKHTHPIMRVRCPRCRAEPGKRCDPRTLGRYSFHADRVNASQDQADTPAPQAVRERW